MTTHTAELQFADPKEEDLPIRILICSDRYWKFVKYNTQVRISRSVVLLHSNLGLILSGNRSGISANLTAVNFLHSEVPGPLPETDQTFWALEAFGITAHQNRVEYQAFKCSPSLSRLILNRANGE